MIPSGLIGVVHLPALPGDPRHDGGGFGPVERFARRDAESLARSGIVGTWVKERGDTRAPVDAERVATLVAATRGLWA